MNKYNRYISHRFVLKIGESHLKNKGNAKSLYSKKLIQNSLGLLLNEQDFKDISILDITRHANVSRNTFYRNFDSKTAILELTVLEIVSEYVTLLESTSDLTFDNIVLLVFTTVDRNSELVRTLVENNLLNLLIDKLHEDLVSIYKTRKKLIFDKYGTSAINNLLRFSFGGFEKYISEWVKEPDRKSPIQVQKDFREMIEIFNLNNELF